MSSAVRNTILFSFLFIYSLSLFRSVMPYIEYNLNKEFIIAELCENKDKPELKCNGTCHLAKQIEKAVDEDFDDKDKAPSVKLEYSVTAHLSSLQEVKFYLWSSVTDIPFVDKYKEQTDLRIFIPPPQIS